MAVKKIYNTGACLLSQTKEKHDKDKRASLFCRRVGDGNEMVL